MFFPRVTHAYEVAGENANKRSTHSEGEGWWWRPETEAALDLSREVHPVSGRPSVSETMWRRVPPCEEAVRNQGELLPSLAAWAWLSVVNAGPAGLGRESGGRANVAQ